MATARLLRTRLPTRFRTLVLATAALLASGCASLLPSPHDIPAVNRVFLHANPQPGDYAVYGNRSDSLQMVKRYEVVEVDSSGLTLRWRMYYRKKGFEDSAPQEWYYLRTTPDGQVTRAWVQTDAGGTFEMTVATPGQPGYMENYRPVPEFEPESFLAGSAPLAAESVHFYTVHSKAGSVSAGSVILEYHASQVPFRVIARRQDNTLNVGKALRSLEFLVAAAEAYEADDAMKIQGKVSPASMKQDFTLSLIEYGFGGQ